MYTRVITHQNNILTRVLQCQYSIGMLDIHQRDTIDRNYLVSKPEKGTETLWKNISDVQYIINSLHNISQLVL